MEGDHKAGPGDAVLCFGVSEGIGGWAGGGIGFVIRVLLVENSRTH